MGDSKFSTWKDLIHGILIEDRNKGAFNNDRKALTNSFCGFLFSMENQALKIFQKFMGQV